ncbi:uncharacterized protein LOC110745325 isoform X2 [Prunus avium]|uniref:Uncharacterized protein LOC110745325 isoform X2 n=1 Tax=Prunus avium TaxID=42229 RepID=A0A6P5RGU2_PRUAV|nr:uncharacterized protein LOC110745325 isoform X2 [Prunus avium]
MGSNVKLMIEEKNKFHGKALSLSYTKTAITAIKEKFSSEQLERFKGSCFGHLLLIEDLKWTPQIVHGLLLRKVDPKTVKTAKGITFLVGNKLIQFTKQQFCLITGLRFGNLPLIQNPTNENCALKNKYFPENKTVSLWELEKAFKACTDKEDLLKLGFVYFAVFVLLGTAKNVNMDMRYLNLVEDLDAFDKYPWGAVSYAKTHESLSRALYADYHRVKVPQETQKKVETTTSGTIREYHIKGFAFAFQIWAFEVLPALTQLHYVVHKENSLHPRILHWRSNKLARYNELMSHIYENIEVDVKFIRPNQIEKQKAYWIWGDDEEDEENVEVYDDTKSLGHGGDDHGESVEDGQENTAIGMEEDTQEVQETSNLPSSSNGNGKLSLTNFCDLKEELQSTKDDLQRVAASNRALRKRVCDLERRIESESLKNKKAIEGFNKIVALMEHHFMLVMEELKIAYGVLNQPVEGHEEPHTLRNKEGMNDVAPSHEHITQTTKIEGGDASRQEPRTVVAKVGVDITEPVLSTMKGTSPSTEIKGPDVASNPAKNASPGYTPDDGANASASMKVQGAKMEAKNPEKEVEQEAEILPTPEDFWGCKVLCKKLLELLKDWQKEPGMVLGTSPMRPPIGSDATVAGDEANVEGSVTIEKLDAKGKGCRKKRLITVLLSPYIGPMRKKRKLTVSDGTGTPTAFNPTKPVPIEDVKAVIDFCTTWKSNISAEVRLEAMAVGQEFFYKLINDSLWMTSSHLDMGMFLIRKRQFTHPLAVGTDWTTADCCLQTFLEPVKLPPKKRGSKKQDVRVTEDAPLQCQAKIELYVRGLWKHGYSIPWTKVRKVYVPFNFGGRHWVALEIDFVRRTVTVYDSYVDFTAQKKEVKKMATQKPNFEAWTICRHGDVPQQADGASCGVFAIKFIEYASAGLPCHTIDPSKVAYYRLKLAIEALREEAYL